MSINNNIIDESIYFHCIYCQYKSYKKFNLERHITNKHKNIDELNNNTNNNTNNKNIEELKCSKCNKILSTKYYLIKHINNCKGIIHPYQCNICKKIFSNSSLKSKHVKKCKVKNNDELNRNEIEMK
jgi:hypothetical protein